MGTINFSVCQDVGAKQGHLKRERLYMIMTNRPKLAVIVQV